MFTIQFKINSKHVVYETVENETIVMNLINGNYFSFDGVGPAIWEFLVKGVSTAKIIQLISEKYQLPVNSITGAVNEFIEKLKLNELIYEGEDESATGEMITDSDISVILGMASGSFQPPVLHKYTDMQDILLLDPIHDVNVKGWPEPKF